MSKKKKSLKWAIVIFLTLAIGCCLFRVACEWPITITYCEKIEGAVDADIDLVAYNALGMWKSGFNGGRVSDLLIHNTRDIQYKRGKIHYEYIGDFLPYFLVGDGHIEANIVIPEGKYDELRITYYIGEGRAIERAKKVIKDSIDTGVCFKKRTP